MVANGCYRYLYYTAYLRYKFEDIPLEITIGFTTLTLEKAIHQFKFHSPPENEENFIFTDVYPDSGDDALPAGASSVQSREIEMTERVPDFIPPESGPAADFIPPEQGSETAAAPGAAPAFFTSLLQMAGKPVVRPSSVVQGEEFQALLSAFDTRVSTLETTMDGRMHTMDGRMHTLDSTMDSRIKMLEAKSDNMFSALAAQIDEAKKARR